MQSATQLTAVSKKKLWAGRILSAIPVLFLIFDGAIHVMKPAPVEEAFSRLGYPLSVALPLGLVEFACITIYVVPRTSVLGAILLTGYLGGAVATHVRVGDPLFNILFPVIVGATVWGGLFLRDERVSGLFMDSMARRSTR